MLPPLRPRGEDGAGPGGQGRLGEGSGSPTGIGFATARVLGREVAMLAYRIDDGPDPGSLVGRGWANRIAS
jgi:hypothetical protein